MERIANFATTSGKRRKTAPGAHPPAIRLLIEAFRQGRPIVPFLAAGISVNTGFPSLAATTNYLAKVRYYINHVFKNPYAVKGTSSGSSAAYLRHHGWPDMNRLNADIWRHATRRADEARSTVGSGCNAVLPTTGGCHSHEPGETCRSWIGRIVEAEAISGKDSFVNLVFSLLTMLRIDVDAEPCGDLDGITALVGISLERWRQRNLRLQQIVDLQHLEMLQELDGQLSKNIIENMWMKSAETGLHLRGDWYGLLMSLTEGDFDIIDDLFVSLAHGRYPSATHTFLAQFVDLLRVRLFLQSISIPSSRWPCVKRDIPRRYTRSSVTEIYRRRWWCDGNWRS